MSLTSILGSITLSKLKLWGVIALGALVMAFGIWVYNTYQENQKLKYQAKETAQNVSALNDSLSQVRGQVVQGAVYVRDLNAKLKNAEKKYTALQLHFAAFADSVHAAGSGHAVVTNSMATVSFQGFQSIAHYSGYTTYAFKDSTSTWHVEIGFSPILADAQLVQHGDQWDYVLSSRTSGVILSGGGALDEDTYRRLQKYAPPKPFNRYMVGLALGQYGGPEAGYRLDNWNLSVQYNMFTPSKTTLENIYLHVLWCPF